MSTYESTVSLMKGLPEGDLLVVQEFVNRLLTKSENKQETFNPYKPLTREELIGELAVARKHAEEGKVIDAHEASANVRNRYGL